MITDEIHFCYKCGELSPEYHVQGYSRICQCGMPTVITLTEAIDFINQRHEYFGESVLGEDMIDEDYDEQPLDFEHDVSDMSSGSVGIDLEEDEDEY